jgi:peptidoglycan/xylan/chitin deacetylase (PgdA/CDA1 family)
MGTMEFWLRIQGRYQRMVSRRLFRRRVTMRNPVPLVSFTFDDFPRSALRVGGAILKGFGLAGTYYTSFGLMGQQAPTGRIFVAEDLRDLVAQGHELGCHTFHHCHSWETKPRTFEASIEENRQALARWVPGAAFKTFSYPIALPGARTKRRVARHFECCRGGGQTHNAGTLDANMLAAYFLEKDGGDVGRVRRMFEVNARDQGWLILATHDVCETPTPYGCAPKFFETVVKLALDSGAKVLPVSEALALARSGKPSAA